MGLRALHRHCRMPATAAALLSVLLYTALVASHIVSQATHSVPAGLQGAGALSMAAGDPGCHSANESHRGLPASPAKKCPFCAGYAGLHVTLAGACAGVPFGEAASEHYAGVGGAQLASSSNLPAWHSRAPPILG